MDVRLIIFITDLLFGVVNDLPEPSVDGLRPLEEVGSLLTG